MDEGPELAAGEVLSWEEFKAAAAVEVDGQTLYLVEWDMAVELDELEAYYANYLALASGDAPRAAARFKWGSKLDLWTPAEAQNLTYCVSDNFGTYKARAVAEMAAAAAEWEAAANVDFIYVPAHDANCTNQNPNVVFSVVRTWLGGACAFFPEPWTGCRARELWMDINAFDTRPLYEHVSSEGAFRHELGHILGLRHEHIRPESVACHDPLDTEWIAATPYDESSVMHYPWCGNQPNTDYTVSDADRRAVELLYGPPNNPPGISPGARVRMRHGSTGNCAYSLGGEYYTVHNSPCAKDPNMVYVLDDAGNGHYQLRHEATNQCIYVVNGGEVRHKTCSAADPGLAFEIIPYLGGYRLRNVEDNMSLVGDPDAGERVYANTDATEVPEQIYLLDVLGPATGYWTKWLNRDSPSGSGDYETLSGFPSWLVCPEPSAILCETTVGESHLWTGETLTCTPQVGLACTNASQGDGECENYRVKFYCEGEVEM